MIEHLRKPAALTAGILLTLAMSACEQGAKTDVAVTAPSNQGGQNQGAQNQGTQNNASNQTATGVTAPDARIKLADCSTPSQGRIYFKVGTSTVAVLADTIAEAIPANLKPPFKKDDVTGELQRQASAGAGCPGQPLDSTLLLVKDEFGDPLLEGTIGLIRAGDGRITDRFAKLTTKLLSERPKNCKGLNGELLACVGTETRGQRETPVMYVISTKPGEVMNSGGPLATRCILEGERIKGCNLVDRLAGGMTFDATLNAGDYSTAKLRSAHNAALRKIETYRR